MQGISNIVWALGQLNHNSPSLLTAIGRRLSQPGALRAFDSQVSGILSARACVACVSIRYHLLPFALHRASQARSTKHSFTHPLTIRMHHLFIQGLSNLAYGCAVLHTAPPGLMSALTDEALQRTATTALNAHSTKTGDAVPPASSPLCLTTVLWAAVELGDHASADR